MEDIYMVKLGKKLLNDHATPAMLIWETKKKLCVDVTTKGIHQFFTISKATSMNSSKDVFCYKLKK